MPKPKPDPLAHLPLKALDFSILLLLTEDDQYGYGIVKRIAEPEMGGIELAATNLYNVLDRMISGGLVEDRGRITVGSRPPRRYFGISTLGREVVRAEAERLRQVLGSASRLLSATD